MSSSAQILRHIFLCYGPESCAQCRDTGLLEDSICPSCKGKGYVVTMQPAQACVHCKGGGRSLRPGRMGRPACSFCNGSGWMSINGRA